MTSQKAAAGIAAVMLEHLIPSDAEAVMRDLLAVEGSKPFRDLVTAAMPLILAAKAKARAEAAREGAGSDA